MTEVRKKLIEVALPLDAINEASAYDKMPGIGPHPKGVHHWWAPLPLPAARAVLFASLIDDPSDNPRFSDKGEVAQEEERQRLFGLIQTLIQKQVYKRPEVFQAALKEISEYCDGRLPTVLDPFSGGGSIPLEAQRLGLPAMGSDLNPIAVIITKALIEVIPRFANEQPVNEQASGKQNRNSRALGLADDVRFYSQWIGEQAKSRIEKFYPAADSGNIKVKPIAWLWARTVKCPNPRCGGTMPLVSSLWLCKSSKKQTKVWLEPIVDPKSKTVRFDLKSGAGAPPAAPKLGRGAKFKCLICNEPAKEQYIKDEGFNKRIGMQLTAVVGEGKNGRVYLPASSTNLQLPEIDDLPWIPEERLALDPRNLWCVSYGLESFTDLFTSRQLLALTTLSDLVKEARQKVEAAALKHPQFKSSDQKSLTEGGRGPVAYADAVATFLAFAVDRCSDFNNALTRWSPSNEKVMNLFGRQAIPMVWDFAEANILADSVGGWATCSSYVADCIEVVSISGNTAGISRQSDISATELSEAGLLVSTDPPYYDNISYANLADFFYVWLRRSIGELYPEVCSTLLTPKTPELVAAPERFNSDKHLAKEHFESGFAKAFSMLKQRLDQRFPMTVYYAFKQKDEDAGIDEKDSDESPSIDLTTGWETLLEALISTGFQITGTWPIRASQAWRMRSMDSNALASYIVLACRPRSDTAPKSTRRDFISILRKELPGALRKLQNGNIAPVDLAQASIGPGMAIFSKYAQVLESDGQRMAVRTALQLINQTLDEVLSEQDSDYDVDTRWAISWFEQYAFDDGPYGMAETLSKAKNTSVSGLIEAGIVDAKAGKVRLYKRIELPPDWDPSKDKRLTVWEITEHLIHALENGGRKKAAELYERIGSKAESAPELAYRLFCLCERKKWSQEALAYNSLVVSWPEIKALSHASRQLQMTEI